SSSARSRTAVCRPRSIIPWSGRKPPGCNGRWIGRATRGSSARPDGGVPMLGPRARPRRVGESMNYAQRMGRLGTETAFEVLARARALEAKGKHVVHLEIGEPDFDTPRFIREAAARALEQGATHYGPSAGLPEFRKAIADRWRAERNIPCDADNVVVTPG